ncbi:hypothetical protein CWE08_12055 [Aliidiomarina iranensis]|uniref:Uncharacterized protein n=1 Tax=Aliidiomarina iranensis TaxID=1434071 RepID=A0A432VPF2_9GAMM|nr:hypothetical protein [Aliidiomarina iranensis]RUO18029.1 hypothetical protein CWE08_12055 [Aliidiomarina iranensis]
MNVVKRCLVAFYIISLALVLVGCSRTFVVKPSGHMESGINFYFYQSEENDSPSEFYIVDVVVQKKVADKKWVAVWELSGKQALERIQYGEEYKELGEVVPAAPLEKGELYRILISEISRSGPKGFSGAEFSIDGNGAVIERYK